MDADLESLTHIDSDFLVDSNPQDLGEKKIMRFARKFSRCTRMHYKVKAWREGESSIELYDLYYDSLTDDFKSMLDIPLPQWTVEDLDEIATDADFLEHHRGCYLLVAVGEENEQEVVVLYFGASNDMAKRYKGHLRSIDHGENIQYFHQRCRELGVEEPLFIPVSYEFNDDEGALLFQESGHIAIVGTWARKNANADRRATWRAVRKMKLPDGDETLPPGWEGGNCDIPFQPKYGLKRML